MLTYALNASESGDSTPPHILCSILFISQSFLRNARSAPCPGPLRCVSAQPISAFPQLFMWPSNQSFGLGVLRYQSEEPPQLEFFLGTLLWNSRTKKEKKKKYTCNNLGNVCRDALPNLPRGPLQCKLFVERSETGSTGHESKENILIGAVS